ncbi:MAG: enoyl-CoA hydratase-related protein [Flammeovirgaceae bacterium]
MSYQNLSLEKKGEILILTINREEKLNALNALTLKELNQIVDEIYNDTSIRGVILTGKGQKAFVAGADISEFKQLANANDGVELAKRGQMLFQKIENCPKPFVAAVNGFALGGGCELALACHFRIASENAQFGLPEVTLGIIPGYGGTQRLTQIVGKGRAFELIMTGERIPALEAYRIGLVNHVFPLENLIAKSEEIISKILLRAPLAVAQAIKSINAVWEEGDGYEKEAINFGVCCKTQDFQEGVTAFLEKRKANFVGK